MHWSPALKVLLFSRLVVPDCFCSPMDCSPPGSSFQGISQARILEWVVISFSRGSYRPKDWTRIFRIGRWILYCWATWESLLKVLHTLSIYCLHPLPQDYAKGKTQSISQEQFAKGTLWKTSWSQGREWGLGLCYPGGRPWCWERLRAGEGVSRGWDGWMASLIQWTWVWANSGR